MSQKPTETGEVEERRSLMEYARMLLPYWWVIATSTLLIGSLAAAWTLRQPPEYQATCVLEFDPNPLQPLGSEVEDVVGPRNNFWMSREFFGTQRRILESRSVSEMVVRRLALHRNPDFFGVPKNEQPGWKGRSLQDATAALQGRLVVGTEKNTRLVLLSVQDRDPDRSAALANAIADAYVERTLQTRLSATVGALEWLNEQLESLRGQLEESELALHRFKDDHNVLSVSMEDRQNQVASDIMQFSNVLAQARARRIELNARLGQLRQANSEDPMQVASTAILSDNAVATLREKLRAKQAEKASTSARYGAEHPTMVALEREVQSLRSLLRNEIDLLVDAAGHDLQEAKSVETGLRKAVDDAQQAGIRLNLQEIEYSRLHRERENNQKLYSLLLERTAETDLTRMLRVTHVSVVDRALTPAEPVGPNVLLIVGLALATGLGLGLLLALGLAFLDHRVKSVDMLEAMGVTVLGVVPEIGDDDNDGASKELYVHSRPRSPVAESARTLRTNLAFMSADEPIRSLVVTSPGPGEGKTTVAVSLAITLAQNGLKTLLVDSDLRRPRIHRVFGTAPGGGLTSVLVGEATLDAATTATVVPNLSIVASGPVPPNPAELLHSGRFSEFLKDASSKYDRVVFDSPPLGPVTDAAVIAPQVTGVLLVVKARQTHRNAVRGAMRQLRDVQANILGGVFNAVDLLSRRYGYGMNGYYYRGDVQYEAEDTGPGGLPRGAGGSGDQPIGRA